ncbi:MAG: hypothetical protein GX661_07130, partial [Acholeplasmataceae bacterium]|nr:hypothetical protein [Acholeplasmataceae bacterium]
MEKEFNIKPPEKKKNEFYKRIFTLNLLGCVSLFFSLLSLFLMLTGFYSHDQDDLMRIVLFFSTIVFSLLGLIGGTIGFLKAQIIRKNGSYVTTTLVLNIFGIIINTLEIIGTITF